MGDLFGLLRYRDRLMAWDGPACPTCRGTGRLVLTGQGGGTWIELSCRACYGSGIEGTAAPVAKAPDRERQPPVGEHAAVVESGLCRRCLGARTILCGPLWRSEPCPDCGLDR